MPEETVEIVTSITRKAVRHNTRVVASFLTGLLSTLVLILSSYHAVHQWSQNASEMPVKEEMVRKLSQDIDQLLTGIDSLLEKHDIEITKLRSELQRSGTVKLIASETVIYYDQLFQ